VPLIFLSYRHVEPDEALAQELLAALSGAGHAVFIDRKMQVGTEWVEEIRRQIDACDFFVVLLSGESIRSDMVRQEVRQAHGLRRSRGDGRPGILPIRVNFAGELPYDLAAYLDAFQYALWRPGEPSATIVGELLTAIAGGVGLPHAARVEGAEATPAEVRGLFDATDARGAPLPQADPRLAGELVAETGTVHLDSPFYVQRAADGELLREVLGAGTTTAIKAPRQHGKSSLMARAHAAARQQRVTSLYLDFQLVDPTHLESLDSLLSYLALRFARAFKAPRRPAEVWEEGLGAVENLTDFLTANVLGTASDSDRRLILLDEVDHIFDRPYRTHFFAMVRGWHNLRAVEEEWCRLNLVLAHSTEPQLWIEDLHQSPFNVATRIALAPFTPEEVAELNERHGRPLSPGELGELGALLAGQPYLVRQALYAVASGTADFPALVATAAEDTGPFGDHLRRLLWRLRNRPELTRALRQALYDGGVEDEQPFQRLKAAGLLAGATRGEARLAFGLYEHYFRRHL